MTERLVLRAPGEADLDAYAAIVADPEVMRHVGQNAPLDRGRAWRELAMFRGGWALHGFGQWFVERRADGVLLGRAGLWRPPDWPGIEVGWTLGREHWGRGYATEAARASAASAREALGVAHLVSLIHPDNAASIRVAEKLGFRPEGRMGAALVFGGVTA